MYKAMNLLKVIGANSKTYTFAKNDIQGKNRNAW